MIGRTWEILTTCEGYNNRKVSSFSADGYPLKLRLETACDVVLCIKAYRQTDANEERIPYLLTYHLGDEAQKEAEAGQPRTAQ